MREARNKPYLPHPKAAQSAAGQTANGPAKAHHLNPGKTAEDTAARRIGDHRASIDQEVATTAVNNPTNTDLLPHLHQASDDQTGAMAQTGAITISPHHHQMADTHSHLSPATAPMAVIAADQQLQRAIPTSPATAQMGLAAPANQTTDPVAEAVIQATQEKEGDTRMTAQTETARLGTGTVTAVIPEVSVAKGGLGVAVLSGGIGGGMAGTTGAAGTISIGDDRLATTKEEPLRTEAGTIIATVAGGIVITTPEQIPAGITGEVTRTPNGTVTFLARWPNKKRLIVFKQVGRHAVWRTCPAFMKGLGI
jgi:hypothetical protein